MTWLIVIYDFRVTHFVTWKFTFSLEFCAISIRLSRIRVIFVRFDSKIRLVPSIFAFAYDSNHAFDSNYAKFGSRLTPWIRIFSEFSSHSNKLLRLHFTQHFHLHAWEFNWLSFLTPPVLTFHNLCEASSTTYRTTLENFLFSFRLNLPGVKWY